MDQTDPNNDSNIDEEIKDKRKLLMKIDIFNDIGYGMENNATIDMNINELKYILEIQKQRYDKQQLLAFHKQQHNNNEKINKKKQLGLNILSTVLSVGEFFGKEYIEKNTINEQEENKCLDILETALEGIEILGTQLINPDNNNNKQKNPREEQVDDINEEQVNDINEEQVDNKKENKDENKDDNKKENKVDNKDDNKNMEFEQSDNNIIYFV
jgi:hypothetical protein